MSLTIKGANTMQKPTVAHTTFVLERTYPVAPERAFAAFSDPANKQLWYGETTTRSLESHELDFRVGGWERIRYRMKEGTPFPGAILGNDGCYLDIQPNRRIVVAYSMSFAEKPFSSSLATFEFLPVENGTTLIFTDQGAYFENSDGPERRQHGWRELLDSLAKALTNLHD
jgi:uncharacterized protein YndB with AHSA1/START domain